MEPIKDVKIYEKEPGFLRISCPYNEQFRLELKKRIGQAKWMMNTTWQIPKADREAAEALLIKFFGNIKRHRIKWESLNRAYRVTVDGNPVIHIGRDHWENLKANVLFETLRTDGSRNNPHVSGVLLIEIDCRPDAVIYPKPDQFIPVRDVEAEPAFDPDPEHWIKATNKTVQEQTPVDDGSDEWVEKWVAAQSTEIKKLLQSGNEGLLRNLAWMLFQQMPEEDQVNDLIDLLDDNSIFAEGN